MGYTPFQLRHQILGNENLQDLALKLKGNLNDLEFYLKQVQVYENKTGLSVNDTVITKESAWDSAQVAADESLTAAQAAQETADAANEQLANMASDDKLSPIEKQSAKTQWTAIQGEKTILDTHADLYSITTEKTAYDDTYTALDTYITPLLADLTITSDIVGATFRAKFSDYYTAKVNLLNKVANVTKELADSTAENFNARNDRISAVPANPTYVSIAHTLNNDGTANIVFRWAYSTTGDEYNVDGFFVFVYPGANNTAYTPGTDPINEEQKYISAEKRSAVIQGVPANKFYTIGVQAYRRVDPDINAAGILKSANVIKNPTPYQPSANLAIVGTDQLQDSAVATLKIADRAVTGDKVASWILCTDAAITYSGTWATETYLPSYKNTVRRSKTTGSYFEHTFTGDYVGLVFYCTKHCGMADIYFDGVLQTTIDTYAEFSVSRKINWEKTSTYGQHTVKVVVKGQKNTNSTDYFVVFNCLSSQKLINLAVTDFFHSGETITGHLLNFAGSYGWANFVLTGYDDTKYGILCVYGMFLEEPGPSIGSANHIKFTHSGQSLLVWGGEPNQLIEIDVEYILYPL